MQTQRFHVVMATDGDVLEEEIGEALDALHDYMEAMAERYNRWYTKAHSRPLCIDGAAYRRRTRARVRRG